MSDAETLTLGAFAQRLADDAEFRGQFVVAARESGVAHDVAEALLVMTADPPDEMEIDLRSPILAEGLDTPIGKLKLREPTAGEMIKLHGKIGIERVLEAAQLRGYI